MRNVNDNGENNGCVAAIIGIFALELFAFAITLTMDEDNFFRYIIYFLMLMVPFASLNDLCGGHKF